MTRVHKREAGDLGEGGETMRVGVNGGTGLSGDSPVGPPSDLESLGHLAPNRAMAPAADPATGRRHGVPSRRVRDGGRAFVPGVALGLALVVAGCTDRIPTSSDPGLIPVDAETFVVELPFADFASAFRVDGGYGSARDLPAAILARGGAAGGEGSEEGVGADNGPPLTRALLRWGGLPGTVSLPAPGGGANILDSVWTVTGGEIILRVDSARFSGGDAFELQASRLSETYHPPSASWTQAVDTLGERRAWSVPGGGPLELLGGVEWTPALGDSIVISLDSAGAAALGDRGATSRSVAVETLTEGAYLRLFDGRLRLRVRPGSRPDTTVFVDPGAVDLTTIESSTFSTGPERILVGGAPAFRTSFRVDLPASVTATGAVCGGPATCQVDLTAERLVYAALVLESRGVPAGVLPPGDTLRVDVRPVLAPELLPRAPLGLPIPSQPRRVAPERFLPGGETAVELPLTRYLRDLLREVEPGQEPVPNTLSLVSPGEPQSLGVATFAGPAAGEGVPFLRLILTRSDGVSLP